MSRPGVQESPKPDDEKSQSFALRLHPAIPEEREAIAFIRAAKKQGIPLRTLFVDLVLERGGMGGRDITMTNFDAKAIKRYLRDILDRLRQGFVAQGAQRGQDMSQSLEGATDEFLDDFDRFLDMGMSDDDDMDGRED